MSSFLLSIFNQVASILLFQAVEQLNLKPKHLKDLLTDEPFMRADIITLQVSHCMMKAGSLLQVLLNLCAIYESRWLASSVICNGWSVLVIVSLSWMTVQSFCWSHYQSATCDLCFHFARIPPILTSLIWQTFITSRTISKLKMKVCFGTESLFYSDSSASSPLFWAVCWNCWNLLVQRPFIHSWQLFLHQCFVHLCSLNSSFLFSLKGLTKCIHLHLFVFLFDTLEEELARKGSRYRLKTTNAETDYILEELDRTYKAPVSKWNFCRHIQSLHKLLQAPWLCTNLHKDIESPICFSAMYKQCRWLISHQSLPHASTLHQPELVVPASWLCDIISWSSGCCVSQNHTERLAYLSYSQLCAVSSLQKPSLVRCVVMLNEVPSTYIAVAERQ